MLSPLRDGGAHTGSRTNTTTEVEHTLRTIFKRCVECPPETPACPTCDKGDICSLVPADCSTCAHAICIKDPNPPPKSSGANVGAIAGGVIGGVAFVAIVVFFVWRFYIKKKRERQDRELEEEWENDEIAHSKSMHFSNTIGDAASTRTRGSLANSILSRASNIIQIAYIPGVTNRNNSSILETNPVPPIPATLRGSSTPKSPLSNEGDMLFFRPGDLRDSTWSGRSSIASGKGRNRDTQFTMKSITPSLARSSVASELYQQDTPAMPATTVARAAPRMVSVKSSNSTETMNSSKSKDESSGATSPSSGAGVQVMMPMSGSTPSKSSSLRGKAKQVTVGGKGRFPLGRQASESSGKHAPNVSSPLAGIDEPSGDESDGEEHARARKSLLRNEVGESELRDFATPLAQPPESPFFDATEAAASITAASRPNPYASMASTVSTGTDDDVQKRGGKGMGGLSAVLEEATKKASRQISHEGLGSQEQGASDNASTVSPFSDANSIR